uniref:Uncharacterized protein n=1 Tax=Strongyloides papillosus TaxID=174720 RepID=A0A0N5CA08_STREA
MTLPHSGNNNKSKNISKTWSSSYGMQIKKMFLDNRQIKFVRRWFKKKIDFRNRIKFNHLKLEPLCCLQSCLIREGCMAVAVIETFFTVTSFICLFINYQRSNELPFQIKKNEIFNMHDLENFRNVSKILSILHKIFITILSLYNIVS